MFIRELVLIHAEQLIRQHYAENGGSNFVTFEGESYVFDPCHPLRAAEVAEVCFERAFTLSLTRALALN